ncbi:HsdR family type I site-specific deoxyribonuclease [Candidatus Chloroploca sp. M-50]|uniref:Type I restriction enzyme endonuclease subunit n=1 Tax=Candidatus Chloroploca mongolica TaxID=2528176 RepID=A0ABS4D9U7_9CHLR|nr:HsdR family type I site-specific deoxyribonuclease [Candidatus Chloroploca mongolica]MBP1466200.1 HsdR family type I site-specific deoxyribonuclease [Candidatus Chloroploca mongolica]
MSERSAVQNPMLRYAEAIGWRFVPREEALRLRGGETGRIFAEVLTAQLLRLNPGVVDAARAGEIVRQLGLLNATIEGNRDALAWLRGEHSVFVPAEHRERNVRLIDFDNPDANIFQVTDEWTYRGTVYANRADVVFLINGIPLALAETKAAGKQDGLEQGVTQVRRYHRETPELLITPQLFEVTQLLDFFYGVTWNTSRKSLFNWKEEEPGNYERKVKAFFDRARMLKVLRDYIVFLSRDDILSKMILRQHQTRAVEKALVRVAEPTRRRGLIWHTQGSGKTLTMITIASKLLREAPDGEKPTVLMIVDRNELEAQLFKNITGYGITTLEVAESKRDLQKLLADDYRGLIVSMIHKFDDIPANVNLRTGVVVLVDEAHRTTGGDLGTYLLAALPNATYIGFTGTPIDKLAKGQGTFKVFGIDDEQGYLDKYNIAESVEDGTTVRLNYALAPSDLRVERETLEREFLSLAEAEGVSDFEELNAILRKAVTLTEALKAEQRVAEVAAFVATHFRENVEPLGFKAFLVAVDRDACVRYKTALDQHLPPAYSQVVISPAHNDPERLKAHYLSAPQEKEVRKIFAQKGTTPKILIVTEKLLTGFDAPILYAMYLDKPMRDHVLLQAIARVNRPYEDDDGLVKPYGFVLDFVGIFEKLERALAFDADVVASVIQNLDVLRNLFATQMGATAPQYLPLTRGWDDKAKERAIEYFEPKELREAFFTFYRQLQMVYDVLSPDAFLRPYLNDYEALAALYHLVRSAYSARPYVDRELTDKTRTLLHEHTTLYNLTPPATIHELGPQELAALKQSDSSDTVKVLNLRRALAKAVDDQATSQPFLISIGEQAESVAQAYEDRQLTTQQALAAFEALAQQAAQAADERTHLGLDANSYALYVALQPYQAGVTAAQATMLNALFQQHPDYGWNAQQASALRTALYQALLPLVGQQHFIVATTALMKLQRI